MITTIKALLLFAAASLASACVRARQGAIGRIFRLTVVAAGGARDSGPLSWWNDVRDSKSERRIHPVRERKAGRSPALRRQPGDAAPPGLGNILLGMVRAINRPLLRSWAPQRAHSWREDYTVLV